VLVLGFGLWLVDLGSWGYGAGWVDTALGMLAATVVLGAFGGSGRSRPATFLPGSHPRVLRSVLNCVRCSTTV
jgi:hypothetical protein